MYISFLELYMCAPNVCICEQRLDNQILFWIAINIKINGRIQPKNKKITTVI